MPICTLAHHVRRLPTGKLAIDMLRLVRLVVLPSTNASISWLTMTHASSWSGRDEETVRLSWARPAAAAACEAGHRLTAGQRARVTSLVAGYGHLWPVRLYC